MRLLCALLIPAVAVAGAAGRLTLKATDLSSCVLSKPSASAQLLSGCDVATSSGNSIDTNKQALAALQQTAAGIRADLDSFIRTQDAANAAMQHKLAGFVSSQGDENTAIRALITAVEGSLSTTQQEVTQLGRDTTASLSTLVQQHEDDAQALRLASKVFSDVDAELRGKITAVTKMEGPKGEKGDRGEKGDQGDKGATGAPGLDGREGRDGADGAPGKDGAKGERGAPGITVTAAPVATTAANANPCNSAPCVRGYCMSGKGEDFMCQCPDGYEGKRCEKDTDEVLTRASHRCR